MSNSVIAKSECVKILKMQQSLVHIKHNMTIRQYKYWHLMMKFFAEKVEQGIQTDKDGFYFESRSKFAEYIGYDPVDKDLKADIEALRKNPIIINYLEKDGKPATHGMGFISEYIVSSKRIAFRLPSFIRNVILGDDQSQKMFLLLNWDIFNSFTGKYEAIIYKLCKDYLGVGRTPYFTIDEYREYVGLKDGEYPQFFRLNEWTIKKPLEAIKANDLSDIVIDVEFERKGRSVVGLYFKVKHKKQSVLPFAEFEPNSAFKQARVAISPDEQIKYLDAYSSAVIEATFERANEYVDQLLSQGKKANIGAIYNRAFTQGWGVERLEQNQLNEAEEKKQKDIENWRKAKAQAELEAKSQAELKKQNEAASIEVFFDALSYVEQKQVFDVVLEKVKPNKAMYEIASKYIENGATEYKKHPMLKSLVFAEAKELKRQKENADLVKNFANLSDAKKIAEVEALIKLNQNEKLSASYNKYGVNAYKHDEVFKLALIEHLNLNEIMSNLQGDE